MTNDDKYNLIADMLADKGLREGEGVQRLAYAMTSPIRKNINYTDIARNDFVYKKPEPGWREQSYANGLRYIAKEQGGNQFIEQIADTWDRAAERKKKFPKWYITFNSFLVSIIDTLGSGRRC